MSMAAAKRTTGVEEWWQTLPERDRFEHSQNFAHRSITPPCQNRGPAKDERKTLWIRLRVDGQRRRRQQRGAQRRVLADCEQVLEDVGSGASEFWN